MKRRVKIIATLGPACENAETIRAMAEAGMDVARLNFSHGTHEQHAQRIQTVRQISKELGKEITILQDLQGPKLRVGVLPENGVDLYPGELIVLTSRKELPEVPHSAKIIPMDVPNLEASVHEGSRVLMDDGNLELRVKEVTPDYIISEVINGGKLRSQKGVNLPEANLGIEGFTEKDQTDLMFGLEHGVDAVAMSFVRTAEDIRTVKRAIESWCPEKCSVPLVIAKIELPEAIQNLHEIVHEADGVMVARGDLGVEMSLAEVPTLQKEIIYLANRHAKIVITATQMLETMIQNPRPTRAEASDVANAVFDGTDAVMLSAETAAGKYPVEVIRTMASIVTDAEMNYTMWGHYKDLPREAVQSDALSITWAARELAHDRDVRAIVVFTETGRTALYTSKSRPAVPILAFTPVQETLQKLGLFWGVSAHLVPFANSVESMIQIVEEMLLGKLGFSKGEQIVLISGLPVGAMRQPNFCLLHTLGETYTYSGNDKKA